MSNKRGAFHFRPHPDVRAKFTRRIAAPQEAAGAYLIRASLPEGETMHVGGFIICMKNGRICTDRTAVAGSADVCACAETPQLSGGNDVEVYVDAGIIEVYVNGGEYVITNAVCGLTDELRVPADAVLYAAEV